MSKVCFLLDSATLSGGTNIIFQHCLELCRKGHDVWILSEKPIKLHEFRWHPIAEYIDAGQIQVSEIISVAGKAFDYCVATWWETVFSLWKVEAKCYVYFVQSIESRFYELATYRQLVEGTYELPLSIITISPWMSNYLWEVHGIEAKIARNGVDKLLFHPGVNAVDASRPNGIRFLVEGPVDVPFKNVREAVGLCVEAGAGEVWLLSSTEITEYKDVDRVFSRIPLADVASIYASCDVLVKLSLVEGMFGPPLEMFHCGGTAVVYDVTGHDDYIVHGVNGLVAKTGDKDTVVRYLRDLSSSPDLLSHLKQGAARTASEWCDPLEASETFCDHLFALPLSAPDARERLKKASQRIWAIAKSSSAATDASRDVLTLQELRVRRQILATESIKEREAIINAGIFDVEWYLRRYPDVKTARADPLDHYLLCGTLEGRDPSGSFSTVEYLQNNPECLKSGVNPLAYSAGLRLPLRLRADVAASGKFTTAGIECLEKFRNNREAHQVDVVQEVKQIRASGLFDETWYLKHYTDVQQSGTDPITHYVVWGAQEGRDPSPRFSSLQYLLENAATLEAGRNPLADAATRMGKGRLIALKTKLLRRFMQRVR